MLKYAVIANKFYQNDDINQLIEIEKILKNYLCEDVFITQYRKEALSIAYSLSKDLDFLISVGGDGTLNEIINGFCLSNKDLPILHLPNETCHDMRRNLGYHKGLKNYLDEAMNNIQERDVFSFNGSFFCFTAGPGFLMDNNNNIRNILKKSFIRPLANHLILDIDGRQIEGNFTTLVFLNTQFLGGQALSKNVSLNDGKCEVILVKDYSYKDQLLFFKELMEVLKNKRQLNETSFIQSTQGEHISLKMKEDFPNHFYLDGELKEESLMTVEVKLARKISLMQGLN